MPSILDTNRWWFAKDVVKFWKEYVYGELPMMTSKDMYALMDNYASQYSINKVDQMRILKQDILPTIQGHLEYDYKLLRKRRGHSYLELHEWAEHDGIFEDFRQSLYAFLDDMEEIEATEKKKVAVSEEPLKKFVRDAQNVHTGFIAENTNQTFELLSREAANMKPKAKTLDTILNAWLSKSYINYMKLQEVYEDMKKWGNVETVSVENDYAYRKALRGAVAKIMTFDEETREELWKRLWEEAVESLEMCAQGHLSRIANVFVGFDLSAPVSIPPRELFQNEISVLAMSVASVEEKIVKAKELMVKYSIPADEHEVWLDAVRDL